MALSRAPWSGGGVVPGYISVGPAWPIPGGRTSRFSRGSCSQDSHPCMRSREKVPVRGRGCCLSVRLQVPWHGGDELGQRRARRE